MQDILHYLGQRIHTPFKKIFSNALTFISIIITVLGFTAKYFLDSVSQGNKADYTNVTLVFFVIALVLWILYREFHLSRKQKYANITHQLNSASRKLRNLNCKLSSDLENLLKNTRDQTPQTYLYTDLQGVLDDVAAIFSLLTGTHCRAALKIPKTHETQDIYVITIARDTNSAVSNRQGDSTRNQNHSDLLKKNTDFLFLFGNADDPGYYINHNIPASIKNGKYENTSLDDSDINSKLSYKSDIVWPIRRFIPDINGNYTPTFYGFLAIDSESRSVFNENWDKQIGATITEQLYETFHIFNQFNTNSKDIVQKEQSLQ